MIRKLIYFFRWPLIVYVLGLIIYIFKVPRIFPWIDIPLHLIGGFVVAYSFTLILDFLEGKKYSASALDSNYVSISPID